MTKAAANRVETAPHGERAAVAYLRLLDLIVRGRLQPGSRAVESELALRIGVSRTPMREALARLAGEGFLQPCTVGRRTELVVAPLSLAGMRELWELIGGLEAIAVRSVSRMGRDQRRQLAAAMAEINDELSAAVTRRPRDVDRISELQTEVHVCFMDACAATILRQVYDAVRPHVQRYEWVFCSNDRAKYRPSIEEHREIIDAIARGDGRGASVLIEQHWTAAADRTAVLIKP
ncbi:MAG TPA: GntR family transcriptional regulator [Thermoanaerobaculia bacterium]|nr:GntR family transcriptional regulator [Thermoanaerobaculia bacterium]